MGGSNPRQAHGFASRVYRLTDGSRRLDYGEVSDGKACVPVCSY